MSAKDFRTWHATVLMAVGLAVSTQAPTSESARKRAVSRVVTEVAEYLGNTPAVCRSSYIDPRVIDLYDDGVTVATVAGAARGGGRLRPAGDPRQVEAAVLRLLRSRPRRPRRRKPAAPRRRPKAA